MAAARARHGRPIPVPDNTNPPFTMHSLRLLSLAASGFALVTLAAPLAVAATASVSANAPTSDVLASNAPKTPPATIGWKHDSSGNQWTGVTFNVNEPVVLTGLTLAFTSVGSGASGASVTLSIVQIGSAGSVNDRLQNATVLQTDQFTLPSGISAPGHLTFDITDITLAASPSLSYAYILRFDESAAGRNFSFTKGEASVAGTALSIDNTANFVFRSDNGGASYYNLGMDNIPQLHLQGVPVGSIPEPASAVALLGLCALATACFTRSRRR